MAEPINFEESNMMLHAPDGLEDSVQPMPVFTDRTTNSITSVWKLTEKELRHVNRTGRIYLIVWGAHPPVCVTGCNPIISGDEAEKLIQKRLNGKADQN